MLWPEVSRVYWLPSAVFWVLLVGSLGGGGCAPAPNATAGPAVPSGEASPEKANPPPSPPVESERWVNGASHLPRDPAVLFAELQRFGTALKERAWASFPALGSGEFVPGPSWAELQPFADRKVPLDERLGKIMELEEQVRFLMQAYARRDMDAARSQPETLKDSPEAIHYAIAEINLHAVMVPMVIDEFVPTLDSKDPSYETRMGGLAQMRAGLLQSLRGMLITLRARRSVLESRRELAETLEARGAIFIRVLEPGQRAQARTWLVEVLSTENDPEIAADLARWKKAFDGA